MLGTYAKTALYDCPKFRKIFDQGCSLIAVRGFKDADNYSDLNALALLASGNTDYHPMLAKYARKVATSLRLSTWAWYYAYGDRCLRRARAWALRQSLEHALGAPRCIAQRTAGHRSLLKRTKLVL